MNEIKVVKFGGSSLADANQFKKAAGIILSDPSRRYVIPSAPGKRFDGDEKVTDMLYRCHAMATAGEDISEYFDKIKARYNEIIVDLGLDFSLEDEFERIRVGILNRAGRDFAASRGEYLNGMILAKYLKFPFVDAANVIFFAEDRSFDAEATNETLREALSHYEYAVIPGFYGSTPNYTIKTFSRGGSDITGSIVARAVKADLYENWTDVSGFMVADPRIVKNPKPIETITYSELRELSYMGATVLHEDAIFPVRIAGIPINIKNTNLPEDEGTMIVPAAPQAGAEHTITGIAGKKGFSVLTIEKDMMNSQKGFVKKVLEAIEKCDLSFEHIPSGIDTMSIIVSTSDIAAKKEQLLVEITEAVAPDHFSIEDGVALVAVVGRGMISTAGTAAKVFTALADSDVNIRMIDQGSSELNIIVGIAEFDFEKAVGAIYKKFVQ